MKKLAVLQFTNTEANPDYQYLEISITEAIEKNLQSRFAYAPCDMTLLRKVAEENYIFPEDYHTRTAGMNLGLLMKQDILIAGGFKIKKAKKKAGASIITRIRIFDLAARRQLADFSVAGPAGDKIWNSVDDIAARISVEAGKILPNKNDWVRKGGAEPEKETVIVRRNRIAIIFGYPVMSDPSAFSGNLSSDSKLLPSDVSGSLNFGLEYAREQMLTRFGTFWMQGYVDTGKRKISVSNSTRQSEISHTGFGAVAGPGLFLPLPADFHVLMMAGGGYQISRLQLDFSALESAPINQVTGQAESAATLERNAPLAQAEFRLGWEFNRLAALEAGINYRRLFYNGASSSSAAARLALVMKF